MTFDKHSLVRIQIHMARAVKVAFESVYFPYLLSKGHELFRVIPINPFATPTAKRFLFLDIFGIHVFNIMHVYKWAHNLDMRRRGKQLLKYDHRLTEKYCWRNGKESLLNESAACT